MAVPSGNSFQNVQTYQESELAYLQNFSPVISNANTKFKEFDKFKGNLGSTITFDLPPRFVVSNTLTATFQPSIQRVHSLTVDQAKNVSFAYSNQQDVFNLEPMDYMDKFGKSAIEELATEIEYNVLQNCAINHTYRFYGDGTTAINSYGQLAKMLAFYRNYGAASGSADVYLNDMAIPDIVNSGLNQFVQNRNEEEAMSWMVGNFDKADFFRSNLLPVHTAGTVGNSSQTLTVVSTNDATGANITQITFSGATASDANAIKEGDLLEFSDNVSGQPNLRYLTFVGHKVSANPVQVRATADAAANGSGQVTVSISPALRSVSGGNQNINANIVAGMQATALPTHRAGLIVGGNALFLGMPQLPDQSPFETANAIDPDSGISLRMYHGWVFGQNEGGVVHDAIWGSTLVDEYAMRIAFPV